nr:PDZ domain-containing protein [Mariniblastus sp.]
MKSCLLSIAALTLSASVGLGQVPVPAVESVRQPNSLNQDLDGLNLVINRLGATSYRDRENATNDLIGRGVQVIQPLFDRIKTESPEISFRIVKVIKAIAIGGEIEVLERVLRRSMSLPVEHRERFASWGQRAIGQWRLQRNAVAVKQLVDRGIQVDEMEELAGLGFLIAEDLQVEIDEVKKSSLNLEAVLGKIEEIKQKEKGGRRKRPLEQRQTENVADRNPPQRFVELKGGRRLVVGGVDGVRLQKSDSGGFPAQKITVGSNWSGEAADLRWIRSMTNVAEVEFVEHSITQSILDELKQVEGIQSILFSRCTYSFDEVRRFKRELDQYGGLILMAVGSGYLGVYGPNSQDNSDTEGSFVSMVSPDSAAMEAGLERGDVIFRVDTDDISSFAELSLAISSKAIDKMVKIHVRRGEKEMVLLARLKSRAKIR